MPVLSNPLTRTTLERLAGHTSYSKGVQYYKQGKVLKLDFDDTNVRAKVRGSQFYDALLNVRDQQIIAYSCSCPVAGFCKHLVALSLKLMDRHGNRYENQSKPDLNTEMSMVLLGILGLYTNKLDLDEVAEIYRSITWDTSTASQLKSTIGQYHSFYKSLDILDTSDWKIKKAAAHQFVKRALNSKYASTLIKEVKTKLLKTETKHISWKEINEYYYARFNFAYYTDNDTEFIKYTDEYKEKSKYAYGSMHIPGLAFFLSTTVDADFSYSKLLGKRPLFIQYISETILTLFVEDGLKTPILEELITKPLPPDTSPAYETLYLDALLLDLRLEQLKQHIHKDPLYNNENKSHLHFYEGSIYFLRGDYPKAMKLYNDGLKLERLISRSSQNTVLGINSIFYILSLIKGDKFKNKSKVERCAKKNSNNQTYLRFQALMAYLYFLVDADDTLIKQLIDTVTKNNGKSSETLLFIPLLYLMIYFYDKDLLDEQALALNLDKALQKNTMLDTKIFYDICTELQTNSTEIKLPDYVTKQNLPSLTDIFQVTNAWERKLDLLKQHFGINEQDSSINFKKTQRFVWVLDLAKKQLHLKKQQSLKSGSWSQGQDYDLQFAYRINSTDSSLSLQEKNILKLFEDDYRDNNKNDYSSLDKALVMLCGMKNVYADNYTHHKLNLRLAKPCLELKDKGNGFYHLKLSHDFENPTVFLEKDGSESCSVVACGPELIKLRSVLGASGIELPISAEAEIKHILKAAEADLEIVSDLEFEDLPVLEAPTKPYVLVYFDAYNFKLKIEVFMNPSADGLNLVPAGSGRERIKLTNLTGDKFLCVRNFKEEEAAVALLLKVLSLETYSAELEGVDACLDLIAKLEAQKKHYPDSLDIEWKQGEKIRVLARTNYSSLHVNVKSKNNWFEYSGEIQLDEDRVVSLDEILTNLQTSHGNYVKLNTGEFLGLTEELKKSLQKLKYISETSENKLHKLAMNGIVDLEQEGAIISKDKVWQEHIDKLKGFAKLQVQLPKNFTAQLRDYQYDGFVWMSRLAYLGAGACLADDMGLGKTIQTIAILLNHLKDKPCMVVAPTSIVNNWQSELDKFSTGIKSHILSETQGEDRKALLTSLKAGDVLLCSYGLLQNYVDILEGLEFGVLVLDESQAIKNPLTKRAIAAKQLKADFRLVLTGTPIENNLAELWSQFDFINPGLLGSLKSFQGKFANAIEVNKDKVAQASLKQLIQPYMLRRLKDQVLDDLPPKIEQTVKIEFDPDEAAFYEVIRKQAIEKLEGDAETNMGKRKLLILAEMSKLRRACCHPSLVSAPGEYEGAKNKEFFSLVTSLKANQHKALVFSQYTSYLKLLRSYLDMMDINYLYLDGSTPAKKRKELVNQFQEGGHDLFLLSLKAGGSGLNLTNADYVIHLDPWWNPAVEDQATDRAHRIGQQKTVNVYRLIMKTSIEEKILQLHDSKRELADELLDEANISAKLSDKELLEMMKA